MPGAVTGHTAAPSLQSPAKRFDTQLTRVHHVLEANNYCCLFAALSSKRQPGCWSTSAPGSTQVIMASQPVWAHGAGLPGSGWKRSPGPTLSGSKTFRVQGPGSRGQIQAWHAYLQGTQNLLVCLCCMARSLQGSGPGMACLPPKSLPSHQDLISASPPHGAVDDVKEMFKKADADKWVGTGMVLRLAPWQLWGGACPLHRSWQAARQPGCCRLVWAKASNAISCQRHGPTTHNADAAPPAAHAGRAAWGEWSSWASTWAFPRSASSITPS